jgi:FMN reductase
MKLVAIGGGLHASSRSLAALKIAGDAARVAGAEVELIDLNQLSLPFFHPAQPLEQYAEAENIGSFLDAVYSAEALLLSAPTYHGTIGGAFKNALDFFELLPREPRKYLEGKVVGLIAVGGGPFWASNTLTALLHFARATRAIVAPSSVALLQARKLFDQQGNLTDVGYISQLQELGTEVVNLAGSIKKGRV